MEQYWHEDDREWLHARLLWILWTKNNKKSGDGRPDCVYYEPDTVFHNELGGRWRFEPSTCVWWNTRILST